MTIMDLLQNPGEPIRAQSLNRLDHVHDPFVGREGLDPELQGIVYKSGSFPHLAGRLTPDTRTYSGTTHADSDSISPRVSTDNLTHDWDKDKLSLGGPVLLTRSVSARTVDNLPENESHHHHKGTLDSAGNKQSGQFLSPHMSAEGQISLVSRSTSCPSMAYKMSPSTSPRASNSPQARRHGGVSNAAYQPGDGNANISHPPPLNEDGILKGDVINDLTLEPGIVQVFPPSDGSPSKRAKDSEAKSATTTSKPINGEVRQRSSLSSSRKDKARSAFVNIGDIPSTVAQKVISDQSGLAGLPQADRNVKAKCLQWLNSIDQDTDSEDI